MNYNKFLDEFNSRGYFVIQNVFSNQTVKKTINECESFKSNQVDIYLDRNSKIRRIERLYNKTHNLKKINKKIQNILKKIFKKEFYIFKDKFNAKPPNGEGFYAHYDGVFYFYKKNKKKRGWYEYSNYFINCLIALDSCNQKNGTIELAKSDNNNFLNLIKNTKQDGTPNLKKNYEKKLKFKKIIMKKGDICFFLNTCPHRSKKNLSKTNRRIMYYTYNPKSSGSNYNKYFKDKKIANSKHKSLIGQR